MKKKNRYFQIIVIVILFQSLAGCKDVPEVLTVSVTNTKVTEATAGGIVLDDFNAEVIDRGVCWSINKSPAITDNTTHDGSGLGPFESIMSGLTSNTKYYVRAYATNSEGTGYGNDEEFTTEEIKDADGNVYTSVIIGAQVWLVENLKSTKYSNGDLIGTTTPATKDISGESSPKYQWAYDGNESYITDYGRLYTWYATTDSRNICPTGWHVPTEAEWTTLAVYWGGAAYAAPNLKESGTSHWLSYTGASNSSGFTALPGGLRWSAGEFINMRSFGYWWTSTESSDVDAVVNYMADSGNFSSYVATNPYNKTDGCSIRCVED
jgi:uncharacterized protein (TIGR02145 family)